MRELTAHDYTIYKTEPSENVWHLLVFYDNVLIKLSFRRENFEPWAQQQGHEDVEHLIEGRYPLESKPYEWLVGPALRQIRDYTPQFSNRVRTLTHMYHPWTLSIQPQINRVTQNLTFPTGRLLSRRTPLMEWQFETSLMESPITNIDSIHTDNVFLSVGGDVCLRCRSTRRVHLETGERPLFRGARIPLRSITEMRAYSKIIEAGISDTPHLSRATHLVYTGPNNRFTAGILVEHITGYGDLTNPLCRRERPLHKKWEDQVLSALEILHSHNILWMAPHPRKILIDRNCNAVIVDFGGDYHRPAYVEDKEVETKEGDVKAVYRIFDELKESQRIESE